MSSTGPCRASTTLAYSSNLKKALIVVAAQEDGPGIGRIRMRQIIEASAECLMPFVRASAELGSVIHTDGWAGYLPLERNGYQHEVTILKGKRKAPSELLPRVHRVISLLKRWLLGTHQGAVSQKHLDYYLDEFTFRFNRQRSKSRGKLFTLEIELLAGRGTTAGSTVLEPSAPVVALVLWEHLSEGRVQVFLCSRDLSKHLAAIQVFAPMPRLYVA